MADNEVKIVVTTQDKSSAAVGGLKAKFTELNSALSLAKQAFSAMKQVWEETAGAALGYAMEIEKLQSVTGTSAEETNALIQVADDARIEFGTLQTALRSMINNGTQPSIDSLADLADKYVELNDPVKQAELVTKEFGTRAGPEMAKLLAQGGDALRKSGDEARKFGGVTEDTLKSAKEFAAGMDELEDTLEGVKLEIGNRLIPIANSLLDGWINLIDGTNLLIDALKGTSAAESGNTGVMTLMDKAYIKVNQSGDTFNQTLYDQEQAINASKAAAEEATTATNEYATANTAMFDSINTGLDNTIANWLEALDFMQNGGLELQMQFDALQKKWAEDPGDPEIERQMEDLYTQTLATKTIIGQIDAEDAAQNISDTLGVSLEEAKVILDDIIAKLRAGGSMDIDVNVHTITTPKKQAEDNPNKPKQQASGGTHHTTTPTTWETSENGQGETAIFIPDGKTPADVGAAGILGGGTINATFNINGAGDPNAVANLVMKKLEQLSRMARNGMSYAGR